MRTLAVVAIACALMAPALAETVHVEIQGEVEYNQIRVGSLAQVAAGDSFVWSFDVDSNNYVDSSNYPTRGYVIEQPTFTAMIGAVSLGLQDPFPGTPYFVLRNNDPAADGFVFSDNTDWPATLPLNENGALGAYGAHFEVGYTGDTLSSLDILDALGTYDYTGLTSFYTVVQDDFAEPMGLIFGSMTITPEPGSLALLALGGLALIRRR